MAGLAGQPIDSSNISNLRDIFASYNRITEACFNRCVLNLNQPALHPDEESCVRNCAGKFISGNHRIMAMFMKVQTNRQQAMMDEAQKQMDQQQAAMPAAPETGASSGVNLGAAAADTENQPAAVSNKDTVDKLQQLFGSEQVKNNGDGGSSAEAPTTS